MSAGADDESHTWYCVVVSAGLSIAARAVPKSTMIPLRSTWGSVTDRITPVANTTWPSSPRAGMLWMLLPAYSAAVADAATAGRAVGIAADTADGQLAEPEVC